MAVKDDPIKFGYAKISVESELIAELDVVVGKFVGKMTYAQMVGILTIYIKERLERDQD